MPAQPKCPFPRQQRIAALTHAALCSRSLRACFACAYEDSLPSMHLGMRTWLAELCGLLAAAAAAAAAEICYIWPVGLPAGRDGCCRMCLPPAAAAACACPLLLPHLLAPAAAA